MTDRTEPPAWVLTVAIAILAITAGILGLVIYVIAHFVIKFW